MTNKTIFSTSPLEYPILFFLKGGTYINEHKYLKFEFAEFQSFLAALMNISINQKISKIVSTLVFPEEKLLNIMRHDVSSCAAVAKHKSKRAVGL